jgi:hypothetical protein
MGSSIKDIGEVAMGKRLLGHMRSNAVGYVAIFLALSGGSVAWAALAKNSVGSKQIKNDQVKSVDVRDDDLSGGGLQDEDLADDSVGDEEVGLDSLTGDAIEEVTLEGVGSVGDFTIASLSARREAGVGAGQTNAGPYGVVIGCAGDGDITVQIINTTGVNDSVVVASTTSAGGATAYASDDDFDTGNLLTLPAADDDAVTQFVVAGANPVGSNVGVTASGTFTTQEFPVGGGLGSSDTRCVVDGTALVKVG